MDPIPNPVQYSCEIVSHLSLFLVIGQFQKVSPHCPSIFVVVLRLASRQPAKHGIPIDEIAFGIQAECEKWITADHLRLNKEYSGIYIWDQVDSRLFMP
jgi:hypothetical protein